jgi:hypothetical protein
MKSGASGSVRPNYLARGVDVFGAIRQIQAQVHTLLDFERGMALNGNAVFADVYDLVEIEHCTFGFRSESGIRWRLNFMPHTPATVGWSRFQHRSQGSHGERPEFFVAPY